MRKITTIATALLLGGAGFAIAAGASAITPMASDGGSNVITAGVPFKAYETVMSYTPENDGMLTISATT